MRDNEIIKALECCYDLDSGATCHQCPLYQTEECREGYLGGQAYSLITRLTDKNKAYKHYYDECLKDLKKANAKIDRLKEELSNAFEMLDKFEDVIDEGEENCHRCRCGYHAKIDEQITEALREFEIRITEKMMGFPVVYRSAFLRKIAVVLNEMDGDVL